MAEQDNIIVEEKIKDIQNNKVDKLKEMLDNANKELEAYEALKADLTKLFTQLNQEEYNEEELKQIFDRLEKEFYIK